MKNGKNIRHNKVKMPTLSKPYKKAAADTHTNYTSTTHSSNPRVESKRH